MASDRIIGLVVILGALAYIVSAFNLQTSFLSDPVGSKTFPVMVGTIAALCGLVMVVRPDPEADWPQGATWFSLAIAVAVLIAYAYALKPMGFLVPTAIAAAVLCSLIMQDIEVSKTELLPMVAGTSILCALGMDMEAFGLLPLVSLLAFFGLWDFSQRLSVSGTTGISLAVGLFLLFKFGLKLGLVAMPEVLMPEALTG